MASPDPRHPRPAAPTVLDPALDAGALAAALGAAPGRHRGGPGARRVAGAALGTAGAAVLATQAVALGGGVDQAELAQAQRALGPQLAEVQGAVARAERAAAGQAAGARAARRMERRAAGIAALQRRAVAGRAVGSIRIPGAGLDAIVVQGAGQGALNRGPGHYAGTAWPGQGGTVGIAGHRTTHGAPFAEIGDLRRGDRIVLRMPYGTFRYRVTGHRVVDPSQGEVLRDVGRERLVLTTCHPRWSATQRLVVEAEPVPGPPVA